MMMIVMMTSGVFRGSRSAMPARVAHNLYEKSTGTVHGRLVRGHSVAGTLTLKQCSRVHQNTPFSFRRF